MPLNSFGNTPPIVDPEKRKIAAQKSTLTRQIHSLEIAVRQLETTGPEAVSEIEKLQKELWQKKVERNALDGLPPPPEPMINEVSERASPHYAVEDAEEGVQRRIGTQNKKKMDPYSEAMKEMEDEYDRVEGAKLQEQEEEKIDEALDHLIGEYEKKDKRSRVKPSVSVNKTSSIPEASVVNTTPPEAPVADATAPQTPEAGPSALVQDAPSVDQTPAALAASETQEDKSSAVEPAREISIKDAQSFKELYQAIGTTHGIAPGFADFSGGFRNTDGRFGAKGFEDLIRRVRRGEASIESIPVDYGIREKVAELLPLDTSSPDEGAGAVTSPGGNITFEEMAAQVQADRARHDAEKATNNAAIIVAGEAARAARRPEENITFAEMYADAVRAQALIEAQSNAAPVVERSRSWWRRSSQAARDAALLSVVAPHEALARNRNKMSGKTKAAIVLGGIGAGALTFWLLNRDTQELQEVIRNVTSNQDNTPSGLSVSQSGNEIPRPPAEIEQSWMDKFREWLRGGSAMKGLDTATVGSEMVAPTSPEVVSGVFEHVVKKGDTVWSIVQHMLPEKFPASVFAKLGPEQVAYITDGLKDALERMTPQQLKELGISSGNIGKIFPGDTINFSKLFENQTLLNDLLEKARGLTQDQIQNIARNIRLGRM
jgi:hypothetical protein